MSIDALQNYEKMMVVSTVHVTEKICEALSNDELPLIVYPKAEYGFFICVPTEEDHYSDSEVPLPLKEIIDLAQSQEYDWIMLDRDAPACRDLPCFEW